MNLHESAEDYLEAILNIKESQGYVRSVDIASYMDVSKPSVTYATKKLKENGFIKTDINGMILLTDKGNKVANDVWLRHKTLSKLFMYLGVKEKQAFSDACKVEHDLSKETFDAIKTFVKNNIDKS